MVKCLQVNTEACNHMILSVHSPCSTNHTLSDIPHGYECDRYNFWKK